MAYTYARDSVKVSGLYACPESCVEVSKSVGL